MHMDTKISVANATELPAAENRAAPGSTLPKFVPENPIGALEDAHSKVGFLGRLRNRMLLKNSTLPPESATRWQKIKYGILCPPYGKLAYNLTKVFAVILLFLTFVTMLGDEARPGGNFWGLLIVTICAYIGEEIAMKIRLPGLLGMLVAGFILQNVPGIRVAAAIRPAWSSALRSIALVIILIRGGLGLDIIVLKKLSRGVALLAFLPSTVESIVIGVVAHFLLHFDWLWAFALGYLLTAVSPAVLVPSMLQLQEMGLGVERGVPTLLVAASSVENVYAIQVFSVLLSVGFSTTSLTMQILQAPIEIAIGLTYGSVMGYILWYFPDFNHPNRQAYRFVLLLAAGMTAVFGGNALKYSGAGPLACVITSFTAGYRWRIQDATAHKATATDMSKLWRYFQPVLFGLVGASVSLSRIKGDTVGLGIAIIFIGLFSRCLLTPIAVKAVGLNWREMVFSTIAWSPKATVQATFGAKVFDYTTLALAESGNGKKDGHMLQIQQFGIQMLTIAVLCIVITAPIGALGITLTQNRLLTKAAPPPSHSSVEEGVVNEPELLDQLDEKSGKEPDLTGKL